MTANAKSATTAERGSGGKKTGGSKASKQAKGKGEKTREKENKPPVRTSNKEPPVDRLEIEAALVKKYGIPEVHGRSGTDTNLSGVVPGRKRHRMWDDYEFGELECLFLTKVKEKDRTWVYDTLQKCGRDLLFSTYGGGLAKTSILYAAANGDAEMCRILFRYGGKELLAVRDVKQRDAYHYAEKFGFDLTKITAEATVDCWHAKLLESRAASYGSNAGFDEIHDKKQTPASPNGHPAQTRSSPRISTISRASTSRGSSRVTTRVSSNVTSRVGSTEASPTDVEAGGGGAGCILKESLSDATTSDKLSGSSSSRDSVSLTE